MSIQQLSTTPLFLICGCVILFVMIMSIFFMVRAWKAGIAIGMDKAKLRKTVISSITFTLLPSVSILLGVIALSGSMGMPLPWLRLSVIGALQYELPVAEAAAGILLPNGLKIADMTPAAFSTIGLVMSASIIWGGVMTIFFNKRYTSKLQKKSADGSEKKKGGMNLGDMAMVAMFTGLVASNVGSYVATWICGLMGRPVKEGVTLFDSALPLVAVGVSALSMAVMTWLVEKKKIRWLDDFSLAGSMLIGMAAVVVVNVLCGTPMAAN